MKHYLSIKAGETKVIKKSAKILSVIEYGAVTVFSTCGNLPTPEAAKCYQVSWGSSDHTSSPYSLDDQQTYVSEIEILGVVYTIGVRADYFVDLKAKFIEVLPSSIIKSIDVIDGAPGTAHVIDVLFNFQCAASIIDTMKIKLVGNGFVNGLYVTPVEISCGG